jgi:hypothetical protein
MDGCFSHSESEVRLHFERLMQACALGVHLGCTKIERRSVDWVLSIGFFRLPVAGCAS